VRRNLVLSDWLLNIHPEGAGGFEHARPGEVTQAADAVAGGRGLEGDVSGSGVMPVVDVRAAEEGEAAHAEGGGEMGRGAIHGENHAGMGAEPEEVFQ